MYFWNIHTLKSELKQEQYTERTIFQYFFASMSLYSLSTIPYLGATRIDVYDALLSVLITASGLYYIYKKNGGANGKRFLERYFALSWVTGIRWMIQLVLPVFIVYFLLGMAAGFMFETTTVGDVLLVNGLYIIYFWNLGQHISDLTKQ